MARLAALAAIALAVAAPPRPAAAQSLQTLHVRNFSLAVDRTAVTVGEPFRLTIRADVRETLGRIDDVTLPDLAGFDELGDERNCSTTQNGTACLETLTLVPMTQGNIALGPATLEAIDGRSGKASRFATNVVAIVVSPGAMIAGETIRDAIYGAAGFILRIALLLLVLFVVLGFFSLALRRRRRRPAAPVPAPAAPVPATVPVASFEALVAALAREPSRPRVVAVRDALRTRFGAGERETLRDLTARGAVREPRDAAALAALERAAFCDAAELPRAVEEALPYLR